MMKHGVFVPALVCWLSAAVFAAEAPPGGPQALSVEELETISGGDLILSVDRDRQMMTVTRINPGNYQSVECYSLKVTTSVVRNGDVGPNNPKGAMENIRRTLTTAAGQVNPKQFPTGTANLSPTLASSASYTGPALVTTATQKVTLVVNGERVGEVADVGYLIHYLDPSQSTNTLGCIGVQSLDGMNRLAESLRLDNASYAKPSQAKQTVTVSAYTNNTPPPAKTFTATEAKKPISAAKPAKPL